MDLRPRLEMAGRGLMGMLNPECDLMPTHGYEVAHDTGRWWDAALRLEEAVGFAIPTDLEAASLSNLHRLTDNPDKLLMNRPDVPWLADKAIINPHNFRETLLAMTGLARRRQSVWARHNALKLACSLGDILEPDGRANLSRLGSWGAVPGPTDPSHNEAATVGDWFDGTATTGRAIEPLVELYELTGDSDVLAVAQRIAEHHLATSVHPDGRMREEIVHPDNVGHCHSYHGTLRGLLRFGLLTEQRDYVEAVEKTYRHAVRCGIVHESGWAPHDLGMMRFANEHGDPVSDPASAGDSAQIALWLALHADCDDLLDDVERLVRARLVPMQLTDTDLAKSEADHQDALPARLPGSWKIHSLTHAGKGCTPDVHAAVTHSLCDIQQQVVTRSATGVRVNLHFAADCHGLHVASRRDERARLTVDVESPVEVQVRVPGWVPDASLQLSVDEQVMPLQRRGVFACVSKEQLKPGSRIEMSHDLPSRHTREVMPSGRTYELAWRGDAVAGISPQDQPQPFYSAKV